MIDEFSVPDHQTSKRAGEITSAYRRASKFVFVASGDMNKKGLTGHFGRAKQVVGIGWGVEITKEGAEYLMSEYSLTEIPCSLSFNGFYPDQDIKSNVPISVLSVTV